MTDKNLEIVVGLLAGVEASHFFFGRLPSKFTTRKFATDPRDVENLKSALVESFVVGGVLIVLVSWLMRSAWTFLCGFTVMILLSILYLNDIYGWF